MQERIRILFFLLLPPISAHAFASDPVPAPDPDPTLPPALTIIILGSKLLEKEGIDHQLLFITSTNLKYFHIYHPAN